MSPAASASPISTVMSGSDLAAYDSLPPILRAEVRKSSWPLPCPLLAQVVQQRGVNAALWQMREWEKKFAVEHKRLIAQVCRR